MFAVLGVALWCGCRREETAARHIRSLAEIPLPNPKLYEHVQDYTHWRNPYLQVLPDGVGILSGAFKKKVPVGALEQTLLSLPPTAWPFGRVVAVQAGGGPGGGSDNRQRIEQNRVQVEAILKAAGVTIDYWPGA